MESKQVVANFKDNKCTRSTDLELNDSKKDSKGGEGHFDEKVLEKYNTSLVDTDTEEEEEDVKENLVVDYRCIRQEILPIRSIFITCHI